MEFFPSRKIFLKIGSIEITWYAILIISGMIIAYYLSRYYYKKRRNAKATDDFLDDILCIIIIAGILGARLWFCLFYNLDYYLSNPSQILAIWDGGLAIHGGLIIGGLSCLVYCKHKGFSFLRTADVVFPTVLIAQAIGRWGNFVNQECHGPEVSESFFDGILFFLKDGMCINGTYYMPMFFFESCGCILGFILIKFVLEKHQNKRGDLFWAYLMWYGIVRLIIETFRTDSLYIGNTGIKTAQVVSLVYILIGSLGYIGLFDKLFIKNKKKPTILFDFDETLASTYDLVAKTYEVLLERHNKSELYTPELRKSLIGPSIFEILPKLFPGEEINVIAEEFRSIQPGLINDTVKPIDGAIEVLSKLKEEGYNIGIVSSRNKPSLINISHITGIDKYIDDMIGEDDVSKNKPDPEGIATIIARNKWNGDDVIYIGDRATDVNCAKNYGAYGIAYVRKEIYREELVEAKPNEITTDLRDIINIVDKNINFTYTTL